MKGLCYLKPGVIKLQEVPKPKIIEPTDVIGKVIMTTICGSDIHIIKGELDFITKNVEETGRGVVLGHEGIIEVEQVGSAVKNLRPKDVCIMSCISCCGKCHYCKEGCPAHCLNSVGICGCYIGSMIDGAQAEYVRVPYADHSLYKCPEGVPLSSSLMLSDILPTSYELGVLNGNVKEGSTVAIVGVGPIGLAALLSAKAMKPAYIVAIDLDDTRLEKAKSLGADYTVNSGKTDVIKFINELPSIDGRLPGMNTAIECVGSPATFELCQEIVGVNGTVANVGIHGKSAKALIDKLWIMNVNITTGVVNCTSTKELMGRMIKGELDPSKLITHHFKLSEIEEAYKVFSNAAESKAIKIVIENDY